MSLQPSETGDVSSRGEGAGSQIIGLCTGIGRPRELDRSGFGFQVHHSLAMEYWGIYLTSSSLFVIFKIEVISLRWF